MNTRKETTPATWERYIAIGSVAGAWWLSILGAITLSLNGVAVPHELYYVAMGAFGALSELLGRRLTQVKSNGANGG